MLKKLAYTLVIDYICGNATTMKNTFINPFDFEKPCGRAINFKRVF